MSLKKLKSNYGEIISYLIVGVLTTVVSMGVYYGLVLTVLDPNDAILLQAANVISWVAAVTFAYFANRKFVFKSKEKNMLKEAAKFYGSRVVTLLMDMALMFILVTLIGMNDKWAKIIVQIVVMAANYFLSKLFVFNARKKRRNAKNTEGNVLNDTE